MHFVSIFDSFISSIILNTSRFTSSILLGTHILPNKSPTVLQLPLQLFILITRGRRVNF